MSNALNQIRLSTVGSIVGSIALLGIVGCQSGPNSGAKDTIDSQNSAQKSSSNRVILDWNEATFKAYVAQNGYTDPMPTSRGLAMVHLAMHDAVTAIIGDYEPYNELPKDADADPVAAAATAAHRVLIAQLPEQAEALDAQLAMSLTSEGGSVGDPKARERGIAVGEAAASAIMSRREGDGSETFGEYNPTGKPGKFSKPPPYNIAYRPAWAEIKPFGLTSPDQFRTAPPPALNSKEYADDYNEVKTKGRKDSSTRTADESEYGAYWYELSEFGWNRIARSLAAEKGLDLSSTARLFALLNIAMADSNIAGYDSKYHYAFWRPVTAIPVAKTDGNPATEAEAGWLPFMDTPPTPDHPSTHAALADSSAEVLASVFGDDTSFTMKSMTAPDPDKGRSFQSFSQAADENADSRVVIGIHFRSSVKEGQLLGRQVGKYVVENYLSPVE